MISKVKESHNDREHAELSGSSASRWLNCSGSVLLGRKCPKQEASDAAIEGTRLHEIAERELEAFFSFLHNGPQPGKRPYDSANIQEPYVRQVVSLVYEKILNKQVTGKVFKQEMRLYVSQKYKMFGMGDLVGCEIDNRGKRVGTVADWKFGHYEVAIDKNAQIIFYLVGLLNTIRAGGKDLDYLRGIIIQPQSEEPYKEVVYTAKQIESWEKKFLDAAYKIYVQKKFTFKVGEWCGFCPAKAICEAYTKDIEKKTEISLVNIGKVKLPDVETIPMAKIELIAVYADSIRDYLKKCEAMLSTKLQRGSYNGKHLKLVEGAARRSWIKDKERVKLELTRLGVKKATVEELINIGDAEDKLIELYKKKGLRFKDGKKLNQKELKEFVGKKLSSLAPKGTPGLNLVPLTHKSPPVKNVIDVFTDEREDV